MIKIPYTFIESVIARTAHGTPWVERQPLGELSDYITRVVVHMNELGIGDAICFECGVYQNGTQHRHTLTYQITEGGPVAVADEYVVGLDEPRERFSDPIIQPRDQTK